MGKKAEQMFRTLKSIEELDDYLFDMPGFIGFLPEQVYRDHPAANQSHLKEYQHSFEHVREAMKNIPTENRNFDMGHAVHFGVLESYDLFKKRVVQLPKFNLRTKVDKAAKELFLAENAGKILLSHDDYISCERMIEAVYRHPIACNLFKDGYAELSGFYHMPDTDEDGNEIETLCKVRLDYWKPQDNLIVDLKTTGKKATKEEFTKSYMNFGYYLQAAFYSDVMRGLTGNDQRFQFVVVEKTPPYKVLVIEDDYGEWTELGTTEYKHYLSLHRKCIKANSWKDKPTVDQFDSPPLWFKEKKTFL